MGGATIFSAQTDSHVKKKTLVILLYLPSLSPSHTHTTHQSISDNLRRPLNKKKKAKRVARKKNRGLERNGMEGGSRSAIKRRPASPTRRRRRRRKRKRKEETLNLPFLPFPFLPSNPNFRAGACPVVMKTP